LVAAGVWLNADAQRTAKSADSEMDFNMGPPTSRIQNRRVRPFQTELPHEGARWRWRWHAGRWWWWRQACWWWKHGPIVGRNNERCGPCFGRHHGLILWKRPNSTDDWHALSTPIHALNVRMIVTALAAVDTGPRSGGASHRSEQQPGSRSNAGTLITANRRPCHRANHGA